MLPPDEIATARCASLAMTQKIDALLFESDAAAIKLPCHSQPVVTPAWESLGEMFRRAGHEKSVHAPPVSCTDSPLTSAGAKMRSDTKCKNCRNKIVGGGVSSVDKSGVDSV